MHQSFRRWRCHSEPNTLCLRQLPFSWGNTRSSKIYLVIDGDGVIKKRKEGKRDGTSVVLLFYSVALAVLISLLKATVFSDLTWLMIPPAWLILSAVDDNLEKKEEGGLICR